MKLQHLKRSFFYTVAAISVPLMLSACTSESQSPDDTLQTSSTTAPTQLTTQTLDSVVVETPRSTDSLLDSVPAPTLLTYSNLRAGYVSLQWNASLGDTIQNQPNSDSVSYYRVFRNGEPFTDAFSPTIEDTNPPQGEVVYAVQAVKFIASPVFAILSSALVELKISVPTYGAEQEQLGAVQINEQTFVESQNTIQTCSNVYALPDGSSLCTNHLGHAWPVTTTGEPGNLLAQTSSVGNGMFVTVYNRDAKLGPVPAWPEWSTTQIATGETITRKLPLDTMLEQGEGSLVNGVAVSVEGLVFISGALYQSYIPRSLGPSPGVLPVTNGYYIAQLDALTGELVRFNRFDIAHAPGAVATVNNGTLEMAQTGLVSFVDAQTLTTTGTLRVSGTPILISGSSVYTQITDDNFESQYFQFTK